MNEIQQVNIIPTDYVQLQGTEVKTTSLKVAERFGRRHSDVIGSIEKLECSTEFNKRNFSHISYFDSKGRAQLAYELTRDGYMYLCMGFTGKEAARVKESFIEAFNKMEAHLKNEGVGFTRRVELIPIAEPVFSALKSVAQEFGLEANQALLYANKATKRETGIDFQDVLQIELKSLTQTRQFTPTELGDRLGMSAVKFNKQLESLGYQEKRNGQWCATEKGKPFSVLLDAGKKHSDGTPIQQLKWLETILERIQQ